MRLTSRVIILAGFALASPLAPAAAPGDAVASAYAISTRALVSNIEEIEWRGRALRIVVAGHRQFRAAWARDFAFSVPGLLAVGEHGAVRDTLELFFSAQREDGLFARLIDRKDYAIRVMLGSLGVSLPFRDRLVPNYVSENGVVSLDGNPALLWAASLYLAASDDREFALRWWDTALKADSYMDAWLDNDGLVAYQPPFSDWADSVARHGRVANTNALHVLALRGLASWGELAGDSASAGKFRARAAAAREAFRSYFWLPRERMVRNFEENRHLAADANLMAIVFGLLSSSESEEALATLKASPLWSPVPGRAAYPDYPARMKSGFVRAGGLADYHDSLHWVWLGAAAARAEREAGREESCRSILEALGRRITADDEVHEVYSLDRKGRLRPVRRVLYRAEAPFSWGAAAFIEAADEGCAKAAGTPNAEARELPARAR